MRARELLMRTSIRRTRLLAAVVGVVAVAAICTPGRAQEWARFRGPNGTGVSGDTTIPTEWTEADFDWRRPIPGQGHGHPVIWAGKLFLVTATDEGRKRLVLCLDADTGKTVWSQTSQFAGEHRKHKLSSYASSTPAVEENRVYVTFASPTSYLVAALDHRGEELWTRDVGVFSEVHGFSNSPMIYEQMVVFQNEQVDEKSFVMALDKRNGEVLWKTPRRSARTAFGTPCVLDLPGKPPVLLLSSMAHGLSALEPSSGKLLWEAPLFSRRMVSSPVFTKEGFAVGAGGSGGGGNELFAVRTDGRGDVSKSHVVYKLEQSIPYVPTPIVKGARLFLWTDKGVVACHNASTGERVWRERVPGDGYYGSPICVGDRIYNASVDGKVVVIAAGGEFRQLAENPILEGMHSSLAVGGGRLYIRTFQHLISVGGKK